MMATESEKSETPENEVSLSEAMKQIRDLKAQLREVNAEARDHRLEKNDARKAARELESQLKAFQEKGSPTEELEALRKENRALKHRGVFDRVAREAGAKTSGKALDALWDAVKYESDKDADPAELSAKIEAAKTDYDFLFNAPADGESQAQPPKSSPKPGPGVTRGAQADSVGTMKIRKSDLQSYDPRVNPMLDRRRAEAVKKADAEGKLQYVDE